jgi:hypothetical protein
LRLALRRLRSARDIDMHNMVHPSQHRAQMSVKFFRCRAVRAGTV